MGKPKVKIKPNQGREDANDGKAIVLHSYNRGMQRIGKPKVKIRTKANECVQEDRKAIDAYSCTARKVHIGGKPKVKIKQVRGLWMGKPKVKMKEMQRKNE